MFVLTYDSNVLAVSEDRARLDNYKESLMGPTREYLQKLEEFEKGAEGRLYVEQEIIRDYLHRQIQAIKEFDTYQVENKNPWHDFVGEKYSEDYIQQRKRNIIERVVHSYRHLFYEGHEKVLGDLLDLTKVTEPPPKLHSTRPTIGFEDFYDENSFKIQEVSNTQ